MASITKYQNGYRVQIAVKGVRESATFRTRREAAAWAGARETEIRAEQAIDPKGRHTVGDLLRKYGEEVSTTKRGARWEIIRLAAFGRQLDTSMRVGDVTSEVIGRWRDDRLKIISAGSVVREFALLSAMFETARREWGWIVVNPVNDVRKPRSPDHRQVVITREQIKIMCRVMGYRKSAPCRSVAHAVAAAMLVALRTGMRAGELCGLTWDRVHAGYCSTPHKTGKTAESLRHVPLSEKAQRLIESMRGWDDVLVFGLKSQTLDAMFRKYRQRAGLSGFTFHDTRHTAATWLAQRINVLDLCKAFGWSNPAMAMIYFNPTAADIAKRMSIKPQ